MTTTILSAASPELPALTALATELHLALARSGETDVRTFDLANVKLAYCQGEFDCWVKTPGTCRAKDAGQEIVRAMHESDRLVLLDKVTFGGHSYAIKRAQDRLIGLLTPFFKTRAALTHHGSRYERMPDMFALGWQPQPNAAQAQLWRALTEANAINMLAPRFGAVVVDDAQPQTWPAEIRALLSSTDRPGQDLHARQPLRDALLEAARPAPSSAAPARPRTAALLVGSAKVKGTSASENMARALDAKLTRQGVSTELHFATEFVHEGGAALAAARSIAAADLFLLVTPLYVDALPALVTRALELVATVRPAAATGARFAALINCGFPEPEQNRTALGIARTFCAQAGYHWAGGLPLGAGGAINPKVPLDEQHGPAEHVKRALDLTVPALVRGEDVPAAALALMTKAPFPNFFYRIMGDLQWRYRAHRNGLSQRALWARPLR